MCGLLFLCWGGSAVAGADSDGDGIPDARDLEPSTSSPVCGTSHSMLYGITVDDSAILQCGASQSIQVTPSAEVDPSGSLELFAPVVTFDPGFILPGGALLSVVTDPNLPTVELPPFPASWQWQLLVDGSHPLNTIYNVDIYDVDMEDTSVSQITALKAAGRYVVCYYSAGSYEPWRSDEAKFQESELGNPLDPPFGQERWLDVRSVNVRQIMRARMKQAKAKGCQAVEPDNVDGYTNNPGFPLTGDDQLLYNRHLATQAHALGLAIALKNDLDQVESLVASFDFAINEQCHQYNECETLQPFLDAEKPVLNAEYDLSDDNCYAGNTAARNAICTGNPAGMSVLILPQLLDDSCRYSCD